MSRPLAILHVDTQRFWSGGQAQALLLARELERRGHRQAFAVPTGSPLAARASKAGFEVLAHDARGEANPLAIWSVWRAARRTRPEILHAHDSHATTVTALAARLLRPRPAVIAHRRVDFPIRDHALSRWKYVRGPDRLVAVSEHVRNRIVADGVPDDRVEVVPDGLGRLPRRPPGGDLRRRFGIPEEAPLVVTVAALVPRKDHPTLLAAAGALRHRDPPTAWIVLGEGRLLEEVREDVARRGLAGRVHYPGFVPDAGALLPGADVFVLPSRHEALGVSLLEAVAAGVPVVATAAGGIGEVVEAGGSALLVPVGDATRIAAAVDRILDDPRLARDLVDRARKRLRGFDAGTMAARIESIYGEALRAADRTGPGEWERTLSTSRNVGARGAPERDSREPTNPG